MNIDDIPVPTTAQRTYLHPETLRKQYQNHSDNAFIRLLISLLADEERRLAEVHRQLALVCGLSEGETIHAVNEDGSVYVDNRCGRRTRTWPSSRREMELERALIKAQDALEWAQNARRHSRDETGCCQEWCQACKNIDENPRFQEICHNNEDVIGAALALCSKLETTT